MMEKLNRNALGLSLGTLWGVTLFIATIWVWIGVEYFNTRGGGTLILLNRFYIGYGLSLGGAFIGIPYAFASGYVGGSILALVYNKFAR